MTLGFSKNNICNRYFLTSSMDLFELVLFIHPTNKHCRYRFFCFDNVQIIDYYTSSCFRYPSKEVIDDFFSNFFERYVVIYVSKGHLVLRRKAFRILNLSGGMATVLNDRPADRNLQKGSVEECDISFEHLWQTYFSITTFSVLYQFIFYFYL